MTTGLDLNDKKQRSELAEHYCLDSSAFNEKIYYYIFWSELDFLRLADKKTIKKDAEYLIDYDRLTENTDYQAKYLTSLIPEIDFNSQTDFNLMMFL